jgi:hypothetical protein
MIGNRLHIMEEVFLKIASWNDAQMENKGV